jgi:hypothetical protein
VLQRLPRCDVRVCGHTQRHWPSGDSLAGVDVVVADTAVLAHRPTTAGADASAVVPAPPKLVLITTRGAPAQWPAPVLEGVGACLSFQSDEQELVGAVRRVIDHTASFDERSIALADHGPVTAVVRRLPHPRGGLPPGALRLVREHV